MSLAGFSVGHTVKLVQPHPHHYRNGRRFPIIGETGIVTGIITNSQYTYTRVLLVHFSQCGEKWEKLPSEVEHEQEEACKLFAFLGVDSMTIEEQVVHKRTYESPLSAR